MTDPSYGWADQCQERFGTHPVQVVHEWNTAVHVQENEADPRKRAFTVDELQALFDHADAQVSRVRSGGRKGWLPVFRDAVAMKVAYGFGLRRTETQMPGTADFGPNPHAAEFGEFGVCQVRFGKARKGSPPKRRSVLTVWAWVPEILAQWAGEARPLMASAGKSAALWPSERRPRIGSGTLHKRFAGYRDALGLDEGLDFHSLRRSYVLAALCDIFGVTPAQLIATRAENVPARRRAASSSGGGKDGVADLGALRPARAKLRPGP